MQAIRDFTHATNKKLGIQMYSYSIFHIFFEQYLYVVQNSIWLLGGALLGVFAVCWLFIASAWASGITLLVVGMILMDLLGVMYLWGIQLNAVSVVNLTMALGIAVEFCAHIVHAFLVAAGSRQQRMATALQDMGASVLSGITITKFAGMHHTHMKWFSAELLDCTASHLLGKHSHSHSRCSALWHCCWAMMTAISLKVFAEAIGHIC